MNPTDMTVGEALRVASEEQRRRETAARKDSETGALAHVEAFLHALAEESDDGAVVIALCEAADTISRREHMQALPKEAGAGALVYKDAPDVFSDLERSAAALRKLAHPDGPDGPWIVAFDLEADGIDRALAALRPAYAMLHGERDAARLEAQSAGERMARVASNPVSIVEAEWRAASATSVGIDDWGRGVRHGIGRCIDALRKAATTGQPVGVVPIVGLSSERIGEACRGLALGEPAMLNAMEAALYPEGIGRPPIDGNPEA